MTKARTLPPSLSSALATADRVIATTTAHWLNGGGTRFGEILIRDMTADLGPTISNRTIAIDRGLATVLAPNQAAGLRLTLALALLAESHEALARGDRPVPTRRREHR